MKFLHHDDRLEPQRVSRMAAALEEFPNAGFVFSRRKIEVTTPTETTRAWVDRYRNVHQGLGQLGRIDSGPPLLTRLLENDLRDNSIGEPTCVMARRSALDDARGFNTHVYGTTDLDLWARLMTRHDVAFVDEELVTYRHSSTSETVRTRSRHLDWLDDLWTLDALGRDPALRELGRLIERQLRIQRRLAFHAAVLQTLHRRRDNFPLRLWLQYEGLRLVNRLRLSLQHADS